MEKSAFFEEIAEIFEIEEGVNENTAVGIDSLSTLSLIAMFDENFDMQLTGALLRNVSKVADLMEIAGEGKFN